MARSSLIAVLATASSLMSRPAQGQEFPAAIRLRIDDCATGVLKLSEAYAAAKLELSLAGAERVQTPPSTEATTAELEVALRCDAGIKATLRLRASGDRSSASRVVPLDDAAVKDRSRVLSLALAEFVRSEWPGLATSSASNAANAPATPESAAASPPPEDKKASVSFKPEMSPAPSLPPKDSLAPVERPPAATVTFEAAGMLRWFTAYPRGVLLGGGAGLRVGRWSASAEALFGSHSAELGTASLGVAAGAIGFQLLRFETSRVLLALEPRVALGATWVAGKTTLSSVVVANETKPYVDGRLAVKTDLRFRSFNVGALIDGGRAGGIAARERGSTIGATGGWFLGAAVVLGH